ncbi:MAG: ribonuclease H-like domain-containing protein [Deltaproteobacteria bacterium]|jgi:uncharacterized protein YprB with RNaseH-like and TPR domain|nr:ribonuclease H-like domain-containing protein [Deltaproteobacteria bacterium]
MLRRTFCHIKGVSQAKEQKFWQQGHATWDDYMASLNITQDSLPEWYVGSRKALRRGDADYFARLLPGKEHWRLALSFPMETMFLDIETTGYGTSSSDITVIGWSLGGPYKVLVCGRDDPEDFLDDLTKTRVLVTFNGRAFDCPILYRCFDRSLFPQGHADLRFIGRQVGLSGGQKSIEEELKIRRQTEIRDGLEAIYLWEKYRFSSNLQARKKALRDLIVYNHEDVEGMKSIFDVCTEKLKEKGSIPEEYEPETSFKALKSGLDFSNPRNFPFSLEPLD